eukprot:SAG31_NODE_4111_length_3573_cov_2.393207_1_plen_207_part_00
MPSAHSIYIVDNLNPRLQAAMEGGALVLCLKCPVGGGEEAVVAYGPGLWATMGPGGARGVGSYMPRGTPLEPLAVSSRWLDFSWFGHVEGALVRPVVPETLPTHSRPAPTTPTTNVILRWLNAPCAYTGPITVHSQRYGGQRTFKDGCQGGAKLYGASYALLSTTAVGKQGGKLIWIGLNLFPQARRDYECRNSPESAVEPQPDPE